MDAKIDEAWARVEALAKQVHGEVKARGRAIRELTTKIVEATKELESQNARLDQENVGLEHNTVLGRQNAELRRQNAAMRGAGYLQPASPC